VVFRLAADLAPRRARGKHNPYSAGDSGSVAGAFRALRDEVEEQISLLDKKPGLTKEEKAIRDKLQEALDISEKFISKEIKDVEKELE